MASKGKEIIGEVVIEAWSLMAEDGLWSAKYKTKAEACRILDSKTLQEIRRAAT